MITVRHGLMVVGEPYAGKTSIINLLAASMGELAEKGVTGWFKTIKMTINPKSVTLA
jgi:dynein heavy chain